MQKTYVSSGKSLTDFITDPIMSQTSGHSDPWVQGRNKLTSLSVASTFLSLCVRARGRNFIFRAFLKPLPLEGPLEEPRGLMDCVPNQA